MGAVFLTCALLGRKGGGGGEIEGGEGVAYFEALLLRAILLTA